MSRLPLTLASARDIRAGQVLWDDVVRGLHLRGFAKSAGWYVYYRTKGGRERKPCVGKWPALNIEGARRAARNILEQVAQGKDPSAKWSDDRIAQTVDDLCDWYVTRHLPQRKVSTQKDFKRAIDHIIKPVLGKCRVKDVTRRQVQDLVDRVNERDPKFITGGRKDFYLKTTAPGHARKIKALLSSLFNLADVRLQIIEPGTNPVRGVIVEKQKKRKRVASADELARIGALLDKYKAEYPLQVACLWTIFLSGGRSQSEIADARYEMLRGNELWLTEHKTSDATGDKVIFLPEIVLALIGSLPRDPSGFIFGKTKIWKFWDMLRAEAECPTLQLRDARRTFASVGLSNGTSLDQLGQLLGHASPQTTRRYAWLQNRAAVREANNTANNIARLMGSKGLNRSDDTGGDCGGDDGGGDMPEQWVDEDDGEDDNRHV